MKNIFTAATMLLIAVYMSSCWKTGEDGSLCLTGHQLILKFSLRYGTVREFQDTIHNVDVFLFDADKIFLERKHLTKAQLNEFQGTTFDVPPGTYHVVCWANVDENSRYSTIDNYENSYIEIVSALTGSPVYYAPYKTPAANPGTNNYDIYAAQVLPNVVTTKEMDFVKAHRAVQVFIAGYENTKHYDGRAPIVQEEYAGGQFNFLLHTDAGQPVTLRQTSLFLPVAPDNIQMHTAEFFSKLIPITDAMQVNIYHPTTNETVAEVNIKQYITTHNITDDSVIPILVVFDMDAKVSISLPSWLNNNIETGR